MKKTILGFCFLILIMPLAASAYALKSGDSIYIPKGETVEGNLYAAGSSLNIEGKVTGDVICAGQSINISGEVSGDVICAGQSINVNGNVGGNLRLAGNSINLNAKAARNAMVFGNNIITSASSSVGWDFLIYGNTLDAGGTVGRDLYGGAARALITGQIGKNLKMRFGGRNNQADGLTVAAGAKINGDVTYTSAKDATIESGATIKGKVTRNQPAMVNRQGGAGAARGFGVVFSIFSALVVGLILISFWREQVLKITDLMLGNIAPGLGWGILILILTPIIAVILLITVIGIPLALISMALWMIAIYVAKILVGLLVGRSLLTHYWQAKKDSLIWALVIGVVIVYLIFALPILGWIVAFLATLWGLGGIALALKKA